MTGPSEIILPFACGAFSEWQHCFYWHVTSAQLTEFILRCVVLTYYANFHFVIHKITFGGPGGSRTRVQNTFLFASYSNNF